MTKTILNILLSSMSVFSEERRRYFSSKLLQLTTRVDNEKAKVYPEYNDAKIARAVKELDAFTEAYSKELSAGLTEILAKVSPNE